MQDLERELKFNSEQIRDLNVALINLNKDMNNLTLRKEDLEQDRAILERKVKLATSEIRQRERILEEKKKFNEKL
jgi:hypothetical protein